MTQINRAVLNRARREIAERVEHEIRSRTPSSKVVRGVEGITINRNGNRSHLDVVFATISPYRVIFCSKNVREYIEGAYVRFYDEVSRQPSLATLLKHESMDNHLYAEGVHEVDISLYFKREKER